MRRYGPFSPLPEVGGFVVFVLANVLIGRAEVFSETSRRLLWNAGLVLVFSALVTILCVRAVKRRSMERAFSTAALFGIAAGAIIWCLYVVAEMVSEGLSFNGQVFITGLEYGLACGAIALALTAAEISVYRVTRGRSGQ